MEMSKEYYELEDFIGSDYERLHLIGNANANLKRYTIKIDRDEDCIVIAKDGHLEMTKPIDDYNHILNTREKQKMIKNNIIRESQMYQKREALINGILAFLTGSIIAWGFMSVVVG